MVVKLENIKLYNSKRWRPVQNYTLGLFTTKHGVGYDSTIDDIRNAISKHFSDKVEISTDTIIKIKGIY